MVGSVKKGTILLGMLLGMIGYILLAALPE